MSLQAVLFDLDGTLIDTSADFIATMAIQCQRHRVAPPNDLQIRNTVSNGARALVSLCFDVNEGNEHFATLRQELLDIYQQELGKNTQIFEQVLASLTRLNERDIPWGIVTNKPRLYTKLLLQRMNINAAVVVCPDDVSHTKPHPEPLLLACKLLDTAPANTLYVGDHERDIQAGNSAQMQTIACTWGYIAAEVDVRQWQADFTVNNSNELLTVIKQFKIASNPPITIDFKKSLTRP